VKELIVCPKCGKPTVKEREVYEKEKVEEISLEQHVKQRLAVLQCPTSIGGDLQFSLFTRKLPVQLVFECMTCGYTKVVGVS